MGVTHYSKFDRYKKKITALSSPLQDNAITTDSFLLEKSDDQKISIYYSPVEYINEKAIVLIVGITPGFRQMKKAYAAVRKNSGTYRDEEILHKAKMASSYEGPMRKILIQMLDRLELPNYLPLATSAELFEKSNHLVHTTGLLPYPVFYKGKNYTGSTPSIWKTTMLKTYVLECFLKDVARLNHPLIIPLGVNVANVLAKLSESSALIQERRILTGFPHPSGANGHRHKQFAANKEQMQRKIAAYFRSL